MNYDRQINITVGNSRNSTMWVTSTMMWSEFLLKIKTPTRSEETLQDYLSMAKKAQDDLKDVGGFVGGSIRGHRRKASAIAGRDLITLDLDNIPANETQTVIDAVRALNKAFAVYSTRKHMDRKPRLRVIFPLDREVSPDEYEPIARKTAELIGIEYSDPTTFQAERLMFWPSCSADSTYVFEYADKEFINADTLLNMYEDWKDISQWPRVLGEGVIHKQLLAKQEDPTEKKGTVGAFCRVYDIESAMDKFIPGLYEATGIKDRYTYLGGSTSGGAIVYGDGKWLYSHHATDPCSNKLVNAFDLIRMHKFSDLDDNAKDGTPVVKMPSYTAMLKLAIDDKEVSTLVNKERTEEAKAMFEVLNNSDDSVETPEDTDWMSKLAVDEKGRVQKTTQNIVLILENDPNYAGKIATDEFSNRGKVTGKLPWNESEESRNWDNVDDAHLKMYLESIYNITGKDKVLDAITITGFRNRFNEVAEYITSEKWDGVKRIDTLLSDYLGAKQSCYSADIMRKALTAAVYRGIQGHAKFDEMIIFTGKQGIGKSTFLSKLAGKWFNDSLSTFEGKEAAENIQGSWIVEVGELSAMSKSEVNAVKQFLSKKEDIYREPYGVRTSVFPRRCIFFGSTNDQEFLRDPTGNRRFWPIEVGVNEPKYSVFDDLTEDVVAQIWAEAYVLYMVGEDLRLHGESDRIALELQNKFQESNPKEGIIEEFLNIRIPEDWYEWTAGAQRQYLNKGFSIDEVGPIVDRDRICTAEIWELCFNGDVKYMRRSDSNEITRIMDNLDGWERTNTIKFGRFGRQKGFKKSVGLSSKNNKIVSF